MKYFSNFLLFFLEKSDFSALVDLEEQVQTPACYATGKAATTHKAHSSIGTKEKLKNLFPENHENPFALSFKAHCMTIHA